MALTRSSRLAHLGLALSAVGAATALYAQPWLPTTPKPKATGRPIYALRVPQKGPQTGVLVMNGRPLFIVEQFPSSCNGERSINSDHAPLEQLPTRDCFFEAQCLAFEGFAAPRRTCGPDRIEVDLGIAEDPSGLHYGETSYLQFFIRVDPDFERNLEGSLIMQAWQGYSTAYGARPALGPAFSILLVSSPGSDDVVDLEFRTRTEVSAEDRHRVFGRYPISKGTWHSVRLELTPRYVGHPDGPGQILVWLDQGPEPTLAPERAINYDAHDPSHYRFHWGYPPDPETRLGSSFDVRMGIYRAGPYTRFKFGLDGIVLTRDKAELPRP